MEILEIIRQTIATFCAEFVSHPYLCYTEHGQHALFYSNLLSAIPEQLRYAIFQQQKVCVLQKEYPTAAKLGKSQRQHWDVSILSIPLTSRKNGAGTYGYLNLLAAIEFGMNATAEHLADDIQRLDHEDSNVAHGFIVHSYRLSNPKPKFSDHDWSSNSTQILTPKQVGELIINSSVEIYYAMADTTDKFENGVWLLKSGEICKLL